MQNVTDNVPDGMPERRSFVRVQDALGLHVQKLVDIPAAGQPRVEPVQHTVKKLAKYSIDGYAEVRRDFPAVAQYINDLEERIRELLLDGDAAQLKPDHKVSLSAGGLLFSSKSIYVPGEVVSMTLTLFPSGQRIGTDAVIVSANDSDEVQIKDLHTYRSEFVRISDSDRGVIEAHVNNLLAQRTKLED